MKNIVGPVLCSGSIFLGACSGGSTNGNGQVAYEKLLPGGENSIVVSHSNDVGGLEHFPALGVLSVLEGTCFEIRDKLDTFSFEGERSLSTVRTDNGLEPEVYSDYTSDIRTEIGGEGEYDVHATGSPSFCSKTAIVIEKTSFGAHNSTGSSHHVLDFESNVD